MQSSRRCVPIDESGARVIKATDNEVERHNTEMSCAFSD